MKSLMVLNFFQSIKKLQNQNQNLISKYLNSNTNSTYSYNIDDTIAINTRWILTALSVFLNIVHALSHLNSQQPYRDVFLFYP